MFCSPFRRRRKKTEGYLTREEAWEMYLAKMEEEANYFTVTENDAPDNDADICTCQTCIVSFFKFTGSFQWWNYGIFYELVPFHNILKIPIICILFGIEPLVYILYFKVEISQNYQEITTSFISQLL